MILDEPSALVSTMRICHYAVERSTMTWPHEKQGFTKSRGIPQYRLSYQLYGINFLSLAVCDGEECAVNDKRFFLPGRLETFKWE